MTAFTIVEAIIVMVISHSKKSLLNRCNTRQLLAFDGFEQGTATSGDIGNLVSQAKLVDASHRVAATDEREGTVLGRCCNSLSNSL